MSHKTFTRVSVFILIVLAFIAVPISANAGGYCGSTYTAQAGDTLGTVSSICGVTVSDLYTANPGISGYYLSAGQVLTIPSNSTNSYNPSGNGNDNGYNNNYNGYNNNPYNYNYVPANPNGTYIVQDGDTFSEIANRYGVSMNDLWNANPNINDENLLYPGQVLNIPPSSYSTPVPASPYYGPQTYSPQYGYYPPSPWYGYVPTPTEVSVPLSYGTVSSGSPMANLELSNKANGNVYVSLQGTARDGTSIIREYPVWGTFSVTIPAGYYYYIASVGGQEFSGAINLPGKSSHSLVFHSNEVDAQ
jgi:LysM repeat protein